MDGVRRPAGRLTDRLAGRLADRLTVSELTELIRQSLEGNFASVLVEGELSNCRPSSSGHLYFTLKDAGASISAVMFKNRLRSLSFEPKDGMLLRVRGSLSVYPPRGSYQIVCEEMEQAGTGDILALLEKRKQALAAEGLFDGDRKKPIPRFPAVVAVVSSPTGAAVRDIINVLGRRAAGIRVIILPAPVQGNGAAGIIARRIAQANRWRLADVLIVGRGGGSLEDLLPFSEEVVVRAVAASAIPVVSAVGHEIDWALCDFAADLRAPTPSAAAELVSENRAAARGAIGNLRDSIRAVMGARLERARLLTRPFGLDDLEYRFRAILQPRLVRFDEAKEELLGGLQDRVAELRRRLALSLTGLEAGSPRAILERGFSVVVSGRTGTIVRRAADTGAGDRLTIRPLEGIITAVTESTEEE
ncbi:MAG: exodeoxyribonuclease VII large subunit [Treponema sp.]|jgi:exodeoxyribonuclease VII large subunit|nr:exodeoxyribonuclease VII large subunit [Treponema sp.]